MRIAFYAPFKPLDHPQPSGDIVIGNGIRQYLIDSGHSVRIASVLRCRWIYWKPWLLPLLIRDRRRLLRRHHSGNTDIWFTFHSYYKGSDLLGPFFCRRAHIPYVMFQGIYATKYSRRLKTWPGFVLNRQALKTAHHVFTNKRGDYVNLKRLLPEERISYITPGIAPNDFRFSATARESLRQRLWHAELFQRTNRLAGMARHLLLDAAARKRRIAREHRVERAAKGVNIRQRVLSLSRRKQFGREIIGLGRQSRIVRFRREVDRPSRLVRLKEQLHIARVSGNRLQ